MFKATKATNPSKKDIPETPYEYQSNMLNRKNSSKIALVFLNPFLFRKKKIT